MSGSDEEVKVCGTPDPRHPGWKCYQSSCDGKHQFMAGPYIAYPPYRKGS